MSALGGIIFNYEEGEEAMKEKNFLKAARLFRMCHLYYEQGELSYYDLTADKYGNDSICRYEYCKSRLTDEARKMLETEENEYYGHWRDFVKYDQQKIEEESGKPSPNKPIKYGFIGEWIYNIKYYWRS